MTATQLTVDGPSRGGKEKTHQCMVGWSLVNEIPNRFNARTFAVPKKWATSPHGINVGCSFFRPRKVAFQVHEATYVIHFLPRKIKFGVKH